MCQIMLIILVTKILPTKFFIITARADIAVTLQADIFFNLSATKYEK
jgi:hypothetical protein